MQALADAEEASPVRDGHGSCSQDRGRHRASLEDSRAQLCTDPCRCERRGWSGTSGVTTASHIHCCTVDQGTGNAGVATQLPSFAGFPLGVSSGSYDQTFDMTLAGSWNPTFVTNNGGTTASALNALIAGLTDDRGDRVRSARGSP